MPMYEYRCRACRHEFETYVSGASTVVTCPACAAQEVTRTLSVFGLRSSGPVMSTAPTAGGGCCGGGCGCH
jgi:putative FmdB family regulatory protein